MKKVSLLCALLVGLASVVLIAASPQDYAHTQFLVRQMDTEWRPLVYPHHRQSYIPVVTADNKETPFTFERASSPLTTPTNVTGDTAGDGLHPDVVYIPGGWPATGINAGKRWWMVFTPFLASDTIYENPTVLCSDDGDTWAAPQGLLNPIGAAPGGSYFNSDPCLMYEDGRMYCYWRVAIAAGDGDRILMSTSTDGVTWTAPVTVLDAGGTTVGTLRSPIVRNVGGTYMMWTVTGGVVSWRTSKYPAGEWGGGTACAITTDAGETIFHVHMIWDGDAFYGIWKPTSTALLFARSYDGKSWDVNGVPVYTGGGDGWDEVPYQTAIVKRPGYNYFDVFYSAFDDEATDLHRIGRGKLHWAAGDDGDLYGYKETSGAVFVTARNSRLRVDDTGGATVSLVSRSDTTTAGFDPRFHFQHGATPATKTTMGWDASASVFAIAPSALGTNNGLEIDASGNTTIPTGLIIPQGTSPTPATKGALFYDTDAGGGDGSLMMYTGAGWETVKDFN